MRHAIVIVRLDELVDAVEGVDIQSASLPLPAGTASIPVRTRMAMEIPKPRDWQEFQRLCVILFSEALKDTYAQEYGRNGQNQGGIDVLAAREGNSEYYVGIQCRRVDKPLKEAKILSDCRAALQIKADIKEIVFATTAPDDRSATDAALAVEKLLRDEGHSLRVVVYGWSALQNLIVLHDRAYNAFFPAAVRTSAPQSTSEGALLAEGMASQIALQVGEHLKLLGIGTIIAAAGSDDERSEDPVLHAKIDTFRDIFKDEQQPALAEKGLLSLLDNPGLATKPWARYRLETNIASIKLYVGKHSEAAERFEAACLLRPKDVNAIANLALARLIQRRYDEAMELSRSALNAVPRADHAVGYLLQAAARSAWEGDPIELIPADLIGSASADLGLAEFYNRRNVPNWAERNIELANRHSDEKEFKKLSGTAVLALAAASNAVLGGGYGPVSHEQVDRAASDLKEVACHYLIIGYEDRYDLVAYLNNAAVLLRLAGRQAECEELLISGLKQVPDEPQLRKLLGLAQAAQGRIAEARETLAGEDEPESRLIAAEYAIIESPVLALQQALAVPDEELNDRIGGLKWRMVGELAIETSDAAAFAEAVEKIRGFDKDDVSADLIALRWDLKAGLGDDLARDRIRKLSASQPANADMMNVFRLAVQMRSLGMPEDAVAILKNRVDLTHLTPAAILYLEVLAEARRDDLFRRAVKGAAAAVRNHPDILWMVAAHAWNMGDLDAAYACVMDLLNKVPDNPSARLLKIEILLRQNRSSDLFVELDAPLEQLHFPRLRDKFRVASLLGHFGYVERAATMAYRLFQENRDTPQAWMTLSILVIEKGRAVEENSTDLWEATTVAPNAAIDIIYEDGEELFFVIEPDESLRRVDRDSWEPEHPLVKTLLGLSNGDAFTTSLGRQGTVKQIRHKYVARLHYVLENYEHRFPEIDGFRRISLDTSKASGLEPLIAELKARREWVESEQQQYLNGPWPLAVFAHRVGADTIDAALGMASQGLALKVAIGNTFERDAAIQAVKDNGGRGCVLDLLSFWTAWRQGTLEVLMATCGRIHLPQSVLDHLMVRRERIQSSAKDGAHSMRYEDGRIAGTEIDAEVVQRWLDDLDKVFAWAAEHAEICPLVAVEELPEVLRDYLQQGRMSLFDSLVLAYQRKILLITDDLPTREVGRALGFESSAWTHQVLTVALSEGRFDHDQFLRWTADLVEAGHSYISVNGRALARAAYLDAKNGEAPGRLYKSLIGMIGGQNADPASHAAAAIECLRSLWSDFSAVQYRPAATGLLLRRLIHQRLDYAELLRIVLVQIGEFPRLVQYMHVWRRGHFLPKNTLTIRR